MENAANWLVAIGTLILASVAVFQETIRGWLYGPELRASIKGAPPDCVSVPFTSQDGVFLADSVYLRLWVENFGNATARNVEVYAKELRRKRVDGEWERVTAFPPMNLNWANLGNIYFPGIAPGMGKHCDIAHISDPARRRYLGEDVPKLGLSSTQTSLAFDLMVKPNHKGHIVGPGDYELDILVAAENVHPLKRTITISLPGTWYIDEPMMLRDGIGVGVSSE